MINEKIKKIYLSGPFFNEEEVKYIEAAEKILRDKGFELFSPREHEARNGAEVGTAEWSHDIFEMDRDEIDRCDCMVMLFHGLYSDTGTAWECGYANARNKPILVVHLGDESNVMVHEGCHANVNGIKGLAEYNFDEMPEIQYNGKMK